MIMVELNDNFIIFKINDLLCALNCMDVQEIIRENKGITSIKRAPGYIEGVINLRGEIVSVLDLAVLFDFKENIKKDSASIIVVNFEGECFGFLVSEVLDIISDGHGSVENSPAVPTGMKKEYLKGVFDMDGQLVSLLNVGAVLTQEQVA